MPSIRRQCIKSIFVSVVHGVFRSRLDAHETPHEIEDASCLSAFHFPGTLTAGINPALDLRCARISIYP